MEYIKFAFTGANLFSSLFLCFIFFYWVMVIAGFLGIDTLDFNYDFDADLDVDLDLEVEIDNNIDLNSISSASTAGTFFLGVLKFSNITDIPLMIYLSIFFLCLWTLSMLTYYLNIKPDSMLGLLLLLQNLVITFLITKIITNPLKKLFINLEDERNVAYIGKKCILITDLRRKGVGQAKFSEANFPYVFNVTSLNESLKKGDKVKVLLRDEVKNIFVVEKTEGE